MLFGSPLVWMGFHWLGLHQSSLKVALTSFWSVFVPFLLYDLDFCRRILCMFLQMKFYWMISVLRLFRAMSKLFCESFCVEIRCLVALGCFAWRVQKDVHHCCCWSPSKFTNAFRESGVCTTCLGIKITDDQKAVLVVFVCRCKII